MVKHKFKVGDICYLNSGSPELTVSGYEQNYNDDGESDIVIVKWISLEGDESATFHEDMLTTTKPFFE